MGCDWSLGWVNYCICIRQTKKEILRDGVYDGYDTTVSCFSWLLHDLRVNYVANNASFLMSPKFRNLNSSHYSSHLSPMLGPKTPHHMICIFVISSLVSLPAPFTSQIHPTHQNLSSSQISTPSPFPHPHPHPYHPHPRHPYP